MSELLGAHADVTPLATGADVGMRDVADGADNAMETDTYYVTSDRQQEAEDMDYAVNMGNEPERAHEVPPCDQQQTRDQQVPAASASGEVNVNREKLIISCIHGAAAMLEDDEALNERKTERVRILCDLLDRTTEDGKHFVDAHYRQTDSTTNARHTTSTSDTRRVSSFFQASRRR